MSIHNQNMSYWDVARLTKLPGAEMITRVDPAQWTTRMKNSVKRMISSGYFIGGYSSVAVVLAKALAENHKMNYRRTHDDRHAVGQALSADQVTQIEELMMGDFTAYRMEHAENQYRWYGRNVADAIHALKIKREYEYRFFYGANAKKARELTPLKRSQADLDKSALICEAIDRNEVFTFNITRG